MIRYAIPRMRDLPPSVSPPAPAPAPAADPDGRYRRRLAQILLIGLVGGCLYLLLTRPAAVPRENALLALMVMVLSGLPALNYLREREPDPLPALPLIGAFYLIGFALPVFSLDRVDFQMLRPEIVTPTTLAVVIGALLLFYFGYWFSRRYLFYCATPLRLPRGYDSRWLSFLLWVLLVPHLASLWVPALRNLPSLHHVLEPAGYVAWGMLLLMGLRRVLRPWEMVILLGVCLPLELAARFASGALLTLVMFGLFGQIVYWYHARRVAWGLVLLVVLVFVPLQPVKDEFRRYTWRHGRYANAGILEKTKLFGQLTWRFYSEPRLDRRAFYESAAGRVALIRMLAYVMRQSPSPVPYWEGETYKSLISKFVPRLLWRDKPADTISHDFGHRYSLIWPSDHVTAMNMPWLVELWVNFGPRGLVLGMLFFGLLFGYLTRKLNRSEMTELEFVVGATILFPLCVNQESHFAIVAGNVVLLYVVLVLYFRLGFWLQPRVTRRRAMIPPATLPLESFAYPVGGPR
ncbi:MAG: hypothetical protein JNN08_26460 [Bryobacterales bacterium]|nr:hypothetical protein [Bryobacterales bacterium]